MFNKKSILFLIIIMSIFNFTGCIQPDSDAKIKKICMQYLRDKYNEGFDFKDLKTSANEANGWVYLVKATPQNDPEMIVGVHSRKGISDITDNYKKQKWDASRGEQVKKIIENKFGKITNFKLGFATNQEIDNKYSLSIDPLEIIQKEASFKKGSNNGYYESVYERVSLSIQLNDQFNQDDVAKNLIEIIQYYNDLNLYFDMELTFYKKEIYGESNVKGDGSFANVIVTANTETDENNIKKLIHYN